MSDIDDELEEKQAQHEGTTIKPPREIDLEKASVGKTGQSYEDGELAPNMTDLQTTLQRLFPQYPYGVMNIILQAVMVARIQPDRFLSGMRLTVNAVVTELDIEGIEFNFTSILQMVDTAFSIGLDGKGRFDVLEVAGAAKESAELDKLSKTMGLG